MLDSLAAKMATRPTPNRLIFVRQRALPKGRPTPGSADESMPLALPYLPTVANVFMISSHK
jgi:hypothetical protein